VFALRRFPRIVAEAQSAVSGVQVDLATLSSSTGPYPELIDLELGVTILNTRCDDLKGYVIGHVPEGATKEELLQAMLTGDQKALAALKDKYGDAIAGSAQNSIPWKGAMVLLGLL